MRKAMLTGRLEVTGLDPTTGRRVVIPPIELIDLEICGDLGKEDYLARRGGEPAYQQPLLRSEHVLALWPANEVETETQLHNRSRSLKRGPKPRYQYDVLKQETLRLMTHHGEFSNDDPEWNGLGKLISTLQQFYSNKFGEEPARSTLQPHVERWLKEWRQPAGNSITG